MSLLLAKHEPYITCCSWGGYWYNNTCNSTPRKIIPVPLNDTGLNWSTKYEVGINETCISQTTSDGENFATEQDCSHGRDVTDNNPSDGHAGFSFTKISATGQELPPSATEWSCVKDNVTGLVWELKTDDDGLHDRDDKYCWYNTNPATNGGRVGGCEDESWSDSCFGYKSGAPATFCNTQAYTTRVNTAGWCGASDWRMPSLNELLSIVSFDRSMPAIDTEYFLNTLYESIWAGVWTGSVFSFNNDAHLPWYLRTYKAFYVSFYDGTVSKANLKVNMRVRLVRDSR